MNANFSLVLDKKAVVAIAVSGGIDSMALLHYSKNNEEKLNISVVAINVEHGIRGDSSVSDSLFVKDYCEKNSIPLISYAVDCPKYAREKKLSIEEAARELRYQCFDNAYKDKKFDFLATAHHQKDNAETVLFNIFRGTSSKGLCGIPYQNGYIFRPLLNTPKMDIQKYATRQGVPFVVDESNFSLDYTRNFLRSVLPTIMEKFPEAENNISKLSSIATQENEFLDGEAIKLITEEDGAVRLPVDAPSVLLKRAVIMSLKKLGVKKDWEKAHVDDTLSLIKKENGCTVCLPKGIVASKEYDYITLYQGAQKIEFQSIPFNIGRFKMLDKTVIIEKTRLKPDLKSGFFIDLDKVPSNAVLRFKREGDVFTKFNGGTKSLGDYLTDKKIALRKRQTLPLLAIENKILAIFGVAISDDVKVDENTKNIIKLTKEDC